MATKSEKASYGMLVLFGLSALTSYFIIDNFDVIGNFISNLF